MTDRRNEDHTGPRNERLPRSIAQQRKKRAEEVKLRRSAALLIIFSWITVMTAFVSVVWDIVNSDICQF